MNRVRCIKAALLLISAVAVLGCKSKQEAPAPSSGTPQQNTGEIKSISGQSAGGAVPTSPQDKADAEAAATRVLTQMEAGDFSTMYKEAEAGFKKIGSEAQFVAKFQQVRQKTGPLMNPQLVSHVTRPDKTVVLVYRLGNDRFISERRLTFARNKSGKMELFGLNQHDEPKQQALKKENRKAPKP